MIKTPHQQVNLEAIETALIQHPAVSKAAVIAIGEANTNQHLVAYIVPEPEKASTLFTTAGQESLQIQNLWDSLVNAGREKAQQPPESGIDLPTFSSLSQHLELLSTAYMCQTLKTLGMFIHTQEQHSLDDLIQQCQIKPRYEKLIKQWLNVLTIDGILQQKAEIFVNVQPLITDSIDNLWHLIKQYLNLLPKSSIVHLENNLSYLQKSAENHVAMLKGDIDPLELFFAQGSLDTADSAYQFNPISSYYNSIAREVVNAVVKSWPRDRPFRILEVGAGTGATTTSILPILPRHQTVYTYTDVSNFFMEPAKKKLSNYPFIEYKQLNIEQNPQEQGYQLGSFDLVIAANVLHIASNLPKTLEYVRSLLANNGLLLLIELTEYNRTVMTTMGFVHGFSNFEDARLENNIPVLAGDKWQDLLRNQGFKNIVIFPENGSNTEFMGQNVIVAQAASSAPEFKPYELYNFLKNQLPQQMIPAVYRLLDTVPMTENGQVDREGLVKSQQKIFPDLSHQKPEQSLLQQANNRAQKRKAAAKQKQQKQNYE